jgi:O-antigen ligase
MGEGLFWALMALVWLAPLPLGANRPWGWGPLGIGIGALLVIFALAAFRDRGLLQLNWRRYALLMIGFALVILWGVVQQSAHAPPDWHDPLWQDAGHLLGLDLPGAITLDPAVARQSILHLLIYGGVFFLAIHFGRNARRARLIFWSLATAGAAYAAYGLTMQLGGFDELLWYRKWAYTDSVTATFVNHNSYATYAGITLIATLALLIKENERLLRLGVANLGDIVQAVDTAGLQSYILITAAIVNVTALLLSQSRAGFFVTVCGVAAFAVAIRYVHRQRGAAGRLPLFGIMLAVVAVILIGFSGSSLLGRFASFAARDVGREYFYALTVEQIGEHPLLGSGLGSFHGLFEMVRDDRLDGLLFTVYRAHNSYLEMALELGLPMFLVLFAVLAGIAGICVRGLVLRQRDFVYPAAGVGATVLVALHSAIDFSLQIPAVATTYALLIGTAYAQSFPTRGSRAKGAEKAPEAEAEPANGKSRRAISRGSEPLVGQVELPEQVGLEAQGVAHRLDHEMAAGEAREACGRDAARQPDLVVELGAKLRIGVAPEIEGEIEPRQHQDGLVPSRLERHLEQGDDLIGAAAELEGGRGEHAPGAWVRRAALKRVAIGRAGLLQRLYPQRVVRGGARRLHQEIARIRPGGALVEPGCGAPPMLDQEGELG